MTDTITIRIPENDMQELKKLIPKKYLNISDAVREAVRLLLETEKGKTMTCRPHQSRRNLSRQQDRMTENKMIKRGMT